MNSDSSTISFLKSALGQIASTSSCKTDGKWLEDLTAKVAPHISEWNISHSWVWKDWPDRQKHYPNTSDIGIDVVARRYDDGKFIAIQCKSRKLDSKGYGSDISKKEFDSFLATSSDELWTERWLVVNGAVNLSGNAGKSIGTRRVSLVNIESEIRKYLDQLQSNSVFFEEHPEDIIGDQTRDDMQQEAIKKSTSCLQEHAKQKGRARGRIILPCGTGKSRIALRIIEKLTNKGQVSVVLCPSIALVAQLRREFIEHGKVNIIALAVCSDEGVAKDKQLANDPTADLGLTSASELKGIEVTTKSDEIKSWIDDVIRDEGKVGIIFGTYQSSHRIAEALKKGEREVQVLVADEAHRTAGLKKIKNLDQKLRDFTVCHDDDRFPAKYRVYQTATPRIYNIKQSQSSNKNKDWVVRDMTDESVFGVELYRKSFADAVKNGWLSDYRIIGIGVNDKDAYDTANKLAAEHNKKLSTAHFLKGLALALVMGGSLRTKVVDIRSSINFMNLIARSKDMTKALNSKDVQDWVQRNLDDIGLKQIASKFKIEHLDAKSKVSERENAKARLLGASETETHGVLNVGIFGEGVDAPSLSAVGFLEARKSPVDVIQAVGRVMRRSKGKKLGYIICPILIPKNVDAETWLSNSGPEEGWRELGQVLLALRAHDNRVEDKLSDLMQLYLPPTPTQDVATMVTLGEENGQRVKHYGHIGKTGKVEKDLENFLTNKPMPNDVFRPLETVVSMDGKPTPPRKLRQSA